MLSHIASDSQSPQTVGQSTDAGVSLVNRQYIEGGPVAGLAFWVAYPVTKPDAPAAFRAPCVCWQGTIGRPEPTSSGRAGVTAVARPTWNDANGNFGHVGICLCRRALHRRSGATRSLPDSTITGGRA